MLTGDALLRVDVDQPALGRGRSPPPGTPRPPAGTASGSPTTSWATPGRRRSRCRRSRRGRWWPRSPPPCPGCASARSSTATPTATPRCWPTWPPPSTTSAAAASSLGLGAGWQVNEHEQYGIDLPPVGERVDRFDEAIQVVRSLLARADHHVRGPALPADRRPVRAEAGAGPAADPGRRQGRPHARHRRPATRTSGTRGACPTTSPSAPRCSTPRARPAGRDPDEIRRSAQGLLFFTETDAEAERLADSLPRPVLAGHGRPAARRRGGLRRGRPRRADRPRLHARHGHAEDATRSTASRRRSPPPSGDPLAISPGSGRWDDRPSDPRGGGRAGQRPAARCTWRHTSP